MLIAQNEEGLTKIFFFELILALVLGTSKHPFIETRQLSSTHHGRAPESWDR
jgi:hypothetical protein